MNQNHNRSHDKVLESGPLETIFSGSATAKIMDFLVTSQEWDYSETDIAKYSDVSIRTVQRTISKLLESGLIKQARTVGNAKMYQLNKSHKTGYLIEKLTLALASEDIDRMLSGEKLEIKKELQKITA